MYSWKTGDLAQAVEAFQSICNNGIMVYDAKLCMQAKVLWSLKPWQRRNATMLAGLAKDWDFKHGLLRETSRATGGACPDDEQDSDYTTSVQKCILPEHYLEPCIVKQLLGF